MTFTYLIPKFEGSHWQRLGLVGDAGNLDWPQIGIYCPHDPVPWLVGSLMLDAEVTERRGAEYWAWRLDYLAGDGTQIRLQRQAHGPSSTQYLVGNQPRDRGAETDALRTTLESGGDTSEIMARIEYAEANTRARIPIECGVCGLRRTFRLENVHQVATRLWAAGFREFPLETFAARVTRRA